MTGGAGLVRGDALRIPLADESVDLIVTSPPYFALRSYQDGGEHYAGQIGSEPTPADFLAALWTVTAECWRVLKPSGSMFVNLGDKYAGSGGHNNAGLSAAGSTLEGTPQQHRGGEDAVKASRRQSPDRYNQASGGIRAKSLMGLPWRYAIGCIDPDYRAAITPPRADPLYPDSVLEAGDDRWILRAEIVWDKPNGLPESVGDRVRRSHEQWFHLTREGRYFAAVDEIREPHLHPAPGAMFGGAVKGPRLSAMGTSTVGSNTYDELDPRGKLPGSVWTIATEPLTVPASLGVDHFAAFPTEWPRRLILGWSPAGGVVLDPFGGTGTTAMVARALGRYGVSLDLSADYQRLARWRIHQSGHDLRVIDRTHGPGAARREERRRVLADLGAEELSLFEVPS